MIPIWLRLLATAFAVYRLASLISSEEGPYLPFLYKDSLQKGVFKWFREKAGASEINYAYDQYGNQTAEPLTNLGRGISCPLCTGGYVAFLLTFLIFSENIILSFFIVWLGIWGFQTFLENLTSDDAIADAIEDIADSEAP